MHVDYFLVHFHSPAEDETEATAIYPISSRFRSHLQNMPGVIVKHGVLLLEGAANEFIEKLDEEDFVNAAVFTDSLLFDMDESGKSLLALQNA